MSTGTFRLFLLGGQAILGAALLVWSRSLSLRYNAWTTRLREEHPNINPPPTPKMRALNTEIFTWILRSAGAFFVLVSLKGLLISWISSWATRSRSSSAPGAR